MYTFILRLYLLTGDIFDKLRQRCSTYALGIAYRDSRHSNWKLLTFHLQRQKAKELHETYRLKISILGYIHYCTEININLLLNTCNQFYHKFRFIFSLNLSENTQNVHFREAKFQNFPEEHAPRPRSVLAALALHPIFWYFCRTNSELLPPGLLLPMVNTQYDITYLNYTKRSFFFQ